MVSGGLNAANAATSASPRGRRRRVSGVERAPGVKDEMIHLHPRRATNTMPLSRSEVIDDGDHWLSTVMPGLAPGIHVC
jgi:hypothetical protein